MSLIFQPWREFRAVSDTGQFLEAVGREAKAAFLRGIDGGHSGRIYRGHQASAPGEYPAKPKGAHRGTVNYRVSGNRLEIGSGMFYATFLRYGTRKMAKRKMSPDALKEGLAKAHIGHFARFRYV